MEKDRSRGIKHIKDKQKYNGNSTKNPKHVPPKSKPLALATNWDRYDVPDSDGNAMSSSTDFEQLANAPISTGGYYELKTDKSIQEELESQKSSSDLFCLDLEMLQKSVSIVPFYKMIDIDKKYFTEEQLSEMDEEASKNFNDVKKLVKSLTFGEDRNQESNKSNLEDSKRDSYIDLCSNNSSNNPRDTITNKDAVSSSIVIVQDSSITSMIKNLEVTGNSAEEIASKNGSEDLEKWLDDILDD